MMRTRETHPAHQYKAIMLSERKRKKKITIDRLEGKARNRGITRKLAIDEDLNADEC